MTNKAIGFTAAAHYSHHYDVMLKWKLVFCISCDTGSTPFLSHCSKSIHVNKE